MSTFDARTLEAFETWLRDTVGSEAMWAKIPAPPAADAKPPSGIGAEQLPTLWQEDPSLLPTLEGVDTSGLKAERREAFEALVAACFFPLARTAAEMEKAAKDNGLDKDKLRSATTRFTSLLILGVLTRPAEPSALPAIARVLCADEDTLAKALEDLVGNGLFAFLEGNKTQAEVVAAYRSLRWEVLSKRYARQVGDLLMQVIRAQVSPEDAALRLFRPAAGADAVSGLVAALFSSDDNVTFAKRYAVDPGEVRNAINAGKAQLTKDLLAVLRGEKELKDVAAQHASTTAALTVKLKKIVQDQVRKVKAGDKSPGGAAGELKVPQDLLQGTINRYWERQATLQIDLLNGTKTAAQVAELLAVETATVEGWKTRVAALSPMDGLNWIQQKVTPPGEPATEGPLPPPALTRELMEVLQKERPAPSASWNLSPAALDVLLYRVDRARRYLTALTYHGSFKVGQNEVQKWLGDYKFRPATGDGQVKPEVLEKLRYRSFRQLLPPSPLIDLVNEKARVPPLFDDLPPHTVYLDTVKKFTFDDPQIQALVPMVTQVTAAGGASDGSGQRYTTGAAAYSGAEQPFVVFGELELAFTTDFDKRWTDKGSTAKLDTGLFHPIPPIGFKALGSYAYGGHNLQDNEPEQWAICVRASRYADTRYPPLAAPHGYTRIWCDKMSTAKDGNGSVWRPIPPEGYVALGDVAMSGHGTAPGNDTVCVRRDLTIPGEFGPFITDDKGSGGWQDLSLWKLVAPTGFASLDPDVGCIAIGGFVCLRNSDRSYDSVRRDYENQWRQVAHCLFLPFPRKEFAVIPTKADGALYRRVWVPMCAINDPSGAVARARTSPFYRMDIRTTGGSTPGQQLGDAQYVPFQANPFNGKDGPDFTGRAFTNRVRLPASVSELLYGDLGSVAPDRAGGTKLNFYVEVVSDKSNAVFRVLGIGKSALSVK